jgi:FlaG/FlaF family flagellin (archaellin)
MPVQGTIVTLTTGAVSLAGSGTDHGIIRVTIRNRGTGTAYLGGSDVTTAGFPLTTADNHIDVTLQPWDELYGTSTGAAVAQILRTNETT